MNTTNTDTSCTKAEDIMIATLVNSTIAVAGPLLYALRKYIRAKCKSNCNVSIDSEIDKKNQPPSIA